MNRGVNRRGRPIGARLGTKQFGNRNQQKQTTFNVTGLGKLQGGFDARQKIGQQTKVADARMKIQAKSANKTPVDARSKIESAKAKKTDARDTIKARQGGGGKVANGGTGPQIRVTGLGRVGPTQSVATTSSGGLTKTIKVNENSGTTITTPQLIRTINNEQAVHQVPVHVTRQVPVRQLTQPAAATARQGSGIYITTKRKLPVQPKPSQPAPVRFQVRNTQYEEDYLDSSTDPHISIENNYYEEPDIEPAVKVVARAPQRPGVMSRLSDPHPKTQPSSVDEMSPLQGFRVMVTNLHPVVSQEDVVELFGAIGALKKARLIKLGTAEVVFVKKEEALAAVRKYHMRDLDGQPMQVVLTTPIAQAPEPVPAKPKSAPVPTPTNSTGPLRLADSSQGSDASHQAVEASLIHKALFRTASRDDPPSRPVTFTVKI